MLHLESGGQLLTALHELIELLNGLHIHRMRIQIQRKLHESEIDDLKLLEIGAIGLVFVAIGVLRAFALGGVGSILAFVVLSHSVSPL